MNTKNHSKRQDLANETAALQTFCRMKRGTDSVLKSWKKVLGLLLLLAAVLGVWTGRYQIFDYTAADLFSKLADFVVGANLVVLLIFSIGILCWLWGGPWQA